MWSDQDLVEVLRSSVPYCLVVALPLLILLSPVPVDAAAEFTVFRLQQYDLHGSAHGKAPPHGCLVCLGQPVCYVGHGSRSSVVNVEARSLDAGSVARRCVLARLVDLTPGHYHRLITQGAAALLILLPVNLTALTQEHHQLVLEVEAAMLEADTQMAVFLAHETLELLHIYEAVRTATNTDAATSAAAAMMGSLSTDGYQIVVAGSQSKLVADMTVANIQGKLSGYGVEEQLPTIAIVAHYDAFGAAPELARGADSNGSGVVVLLELARIFSRLYASPRTHPRLNLAFLLSGGGYINYQGSKRFLEDHLDASDSPLLSETHYTLCLDTLGSGHSLRLHVSKRPKDSSPGHHFYQARTSIHIQTDLPGGPHCLRHSGRTAARPVCCSFTALEEEGAKAGISVEMVHRKINLQEDTQAWEHEKYSMRRLPAFTLSRLQGPRSGERGSILDTPDTIDLAALTRNAAVVTSALLRHIYNTSVDGIFDDGLAVTEKSVRSWFDLITSQPRSPQLLSGKNNPLVTNLHQILTRYTNEARVTYLKADKRDPEWVFYDVTQATMAAYAVKPAAFDFLLTMGILAYLGVIYVFLQFFPKIYTMMVRLASPHKTKAH
ncbi:Nicalin [Chionoecetes opilio]|uniref:BOS complex subunit NCLN n=1 Tax=Chionoecetes opilio TaxID=41210 RepID=A0A8J5CPL5_CHIOP|nr:Nicalin [Chionoecetes opilio]